MEGRMVVMMLEAVGEWEVAEEEATTVMTAVFEKNGNTPTERRTTLGIFKVKWPL